MTEEELRQIRERVNTQLGLVLPKDVSLETSRTIRQLFSDRAGLLAEVEQLRDIVQAVADGVVMTAYDSGRDVYVCSGCEREVDGFFTDEELAGKSVYEHVQPFIVHKPTCIVLTARQLLGK